MPQRVTASRVLGDPGLTRAALRASSSRLRILAYHAVPSGPRFAEHLHFLTAQLHPVSGAEVVRAMRAGTPLPASSVWITFDDGDPSVIDHALPLLEEAGVRATLFVCPAVLDTDRPFWWDVADAACRVGIAGSEPNVLLATLKRLPDDERRGRVEELVAELERSAPRLSRRRQLTSEELTRWAAAGHEVGNHSWDHPLLDRCEPDGQRQQVERAHGWLSRLLGRPPTLFAYPNGNWSAATEAELERLDYHAALGFDHRLATTRRHPLRLSRLRVDADAPIDRLRAIASGLHPAGLAVRRSLTDRGGVRSDARRLPR